MGVHGAGSAAWRGARSMRQDRKLLEHRIKRGTLPRVLEFARPYRRILGVFLVAVILDAAVSSVAPLILRAIIDTGIHRKDTGLIVGLAGLTAALAVFDAGLSLFERRTSSVIGESLIFDLRRRVYAHIQRMPIAFFSRTQTGALISRLNNDVIGAQQAFTDLFSNVVGNVILVAIILAVMFVLSWPITLAALILLPAFLLPARYVGRRLGTLYQRGYELNAEMNMVMTERFNVAGAMVVKLFGRPAEEVHRFESRAGQVRDMGVRQATFQRFYFVALTLVATLATAFAYGFGGVEVVHGAIRLGTVVALTAYLGRLYGPLTQLSNLNIDYMSAMVSFERLFEVLDLEPLIAEAPDAVRIPDGPAELRFSHVDFSYPGAEEVSLASLEAVATLDDTPRTAVLHDVSFAVAPGTMTALVGPSGAGKTTISLLVSRLYDADGGEVSINGVDVRRATNESLSATVGVVTQDPHLFHDTLRANLTFAKPDATDAELEAALRAAQIWPLVTSLPLGLETVVGERGYRLSGGEKQRVALARLLLKAPRVVVLDEATAHLDAESEAPRPAGARRDDGRAHVARDRAPALDDPQRRPDPGRRRRPGGRARDARRPDRARRPLRRPLRDPVRDPVGGAAGWPGRALGPGYPGPGAGRRDVEGIRSLGNEGRVRARRPGAGRGRGGAALGPGVGRRGDRRHRARRDRGLGRGRRDLDRRVRAGAAPPTVHPREAADPRRLLHVLAALRVGHAHHGDPDHHRARVLLLQPRHDTRVGGRGRGVLLQRPRSLRHAGGRLRPGDRARRHPGGPGERDARVPAGPVAAGGDRALAALPGPLPPHRLGLSPWRGRRRPRG